MTKGKKILIIVIAIVVIILFSFYSFLKGTYNTFVTLDESIKASWAQVENQLQRRYDLIPNLVETVKGYAKHEREVFIEVTKMRSQVGKAVTVAEKIIEKD